MNKFCLLTMVSIALALALTTKESYASSGLDQSCKLLQSVVNEGVAGGNKQLTEMSEWMPEQTKSQIASVFSILQNYEFLSGELFLTGKLGTVFREYLLIFEVQDNTAVYFRLYYERISGEMKLVNLFLDSPFLKSAARGSFLQMPESVDC